MYIVLEFQRNNDQISTIVNDYSDIEHAKSKYYTVLSSAAISNVEQHGAYLLDDRGNCIDHAYFIHKMLSEVEEPVDGADMP